MIDLNASYGSSFALRSVDPGTWLDGEELGGVVSVSVERSCDDDVSLLETCSVEVDGDVPGGWYRLWMTARQGGESASWPLGTFLVERTGAHVDGTLVTAAAKGWSVLKPAADLALPRGWYAAEGEDGAALAAGLIRSATPAPLEVRGSFPLGTTLVADGGETALSMAWELLRAGGWCMRTDGWGAIEIAPLPEEPAATFDAGYDSPLMPEIDDDMDLSGVPNVYIAVAADGSEGEAVNDRADSPISTVRRGRRVETVDTSPTPVGGESLDEYAARKLAEASTVSREVGYEREWDPGVNLFDVVRLRLSAQGVVADCRVVSQSLDCSCGVLVGETVRQEVTAWRSE